MKFTTSFRSLICQNKENISYEEYLKRFKTSLTEYLIEYREDVEPLIESLYKMDNEEYKELNKIFTHSSYLLIFENITPISEIINYDEENKSKDVKQYLEIYKKANSLINGIFAKNYVDFINSGYSDETYNNLLEIVNNITEDSSEILELVCGEFDDFLLEMEVSPFLMDLVDYNIREGLEKSLIEKGKSEISRYNRFINNRNLNTEIGMFNDHILLEKRRKNARYN